jgi:hypothetical protein
VDAILNVSPSSNKSCSIVNGYVGSVIRQKTGKGRQTHGKIFAEMGLYGTQLGGVREHGGTRGSDLSPSSLRASSIFSPQRMHRKVIDGGNDLDATEEPFRGRTSGKGSTNASGMSFCTSMHTIDACTLMCSSAAKIRPIREMPFVFVIL